MESVSKFIELPALPVNIPSKEEMVSRIVKLIDNSCVEGFRFDSTGHELSCVLTIANGFGLSEKVSFTSLYALQLFLEGMHSVLETIGGT